MKKRTLTPSDVISILEIVVLICISLISGLLLTNNLNVTPIIFIIFCIGALAVVGILTLFALLVAFNWNIVKDRLV